jgi:hypothetical protein
VGDKLITLEAWLFTQRRIWLYGSGTVVAYAIGLITRMFQHRWLFQEDGKLSCIDFTSMWVSGNFAGSSEPARMYDDSAWAAAWKSLTSLEGFPLAQGHTSYPPILLFFTYPFGLMPYITAFVAWTAVTLLLYLAAIYLIVPRPIAILVALSPFPVFFNLFLGQNAFLLAGLGIVPRLDGATASIIRDSPWPADFQATNRHSFSIRVFCFTQVERSN